MAVTGLMAGASGAAPSDREPPGVRAAPGWELFAGANVPAFALDVDPAGMQSLRQTPREWTRVTLRLGDDVFRDAAMHIKGSEGSLQPIDRRPSLTVSFNKFVTGRKFHGLKKIHFNNTAEDPSFMTEILCGEMCRQAGLPAARSALGTLTLNGKQLGLYVVKEGLTKEFLAQYFENTKGNLYDGGFQKDINHPFERIGGDGPEDQSDRLALLAAAREPDLARRWGRLEQVLDTDRFLTLLAWSTITWNWDGYPMARNNYRIYHDPATDKLVFIPHGLDQMFWEAEGTIYPRLHGLLAAAVMQVPEARLRYRERLATLTTNICNPAVLGRRVDELTALISPYRPEAPAQAARLKRQIAVRARSIAAQLQMSDAQPVRFVEDTAALPGWTRLAGADGAQMEEVRVEGGMRVLRVRHDRPATSAAAARVLLPAGQYELTGRAKVVRLQTPAGERLEGVGLRTSVAPRISSQRLTAASDWQDLRLRFTARATQEVVDMFCEVRNAQGEVWFDLDSLRIQRVTSTPTPTPSRSWLDFLR
jgi:hypothetical protein